MSTKRNIQFLKGYIPCKSVDNMETLDLVVGDIVHIANNYTFYVIEDKTSDEAIQLPNSLFAKPIPNPIAPTSPDSYTVDTIDKLKELRFLKVGDVVEVLGYYQAGDGAGHKRVIADSDDGSGVQLNNGLWANIVSENILLDVWFENLEQAINFSCKKHMPLQLTKDHTIESLEINDIDYLNIFSSEKSVSISIFNKPKIFYNKNGIKITFKANIPATRFNFNLENLFILPNGDKYINDYPENSCALDIIANNNLKGAIIKGCEFRGVYGLRINVNYMTSCRFENTSFSYCHYGLCLELKEDRPWINQIVFDDCHFLKNKYCGIYNPDKIPEFQNFEFTSCTFEGNGELSNSNFGCAVYTYNANNWNFKNCYFEGNYPRNNSSEIYTQDVDSSKNGNLCINGAGIVNVKDCLFSQSSKIAHIGYNMSLILKNNVIYPFAEFPDVYENTLFVIEKSPHRRNIVVKDNRIAPKKINRKNVYILKNNDNYLYIKDNLDTTIEIESYNIEYSDIGRIVNIDAYYLESKNVDRKTIYVSENGNDENDGLSSEYPLQSLDRALRIVSYSKYYNSFKIIISGKVAKNTTSIPITISDKVIEFSGNNNSTDILYSGEKFSRSLNINNCDIIFSNIQLSLENDKENMFILKGCNIKLNNVICNSNYSNSFVFKTLGMVTMTGTPIFNGVKSQLVWNYDLNHELYLKTTICDMLLSTPEQWNIVPMKVSTSDINTLIPTSYTGHIVYNENDRQFYIFDKISKWKVINTSATSTISELNTPYHTTRMEQEGGTTKQDFYNYLGEKFAYDKQLEAEQKTKQEAYELLLKENPNLTWEEFEQTYGNTSMMNLSLVERLEEPVIPESVVKFMEKYLGTTPTPKAETKPRTFSFDEVDKLNDTLKKL